MKRKKQIKQFLKSNYCMINSCMCLEERKMFKYDIVKYIIEEIDRQIENYKESNNEHK